MKTYTAIIAALVLCASAFAAVDFSKPIPSLALPDGRVLKNATFATFKSDTVLIRHAGGSVAVRYEFLPEDIRADVEAKRPGGARSSADSAGAPSVKSAEVKGQIFVQTRGAGAYKFGALKVYAFPITLLSAWEYTTSTIELPAPLASATTDGDGNFTLKVPGDAPYFIFAQAYRYVSKDNEERYEWRVPSSEIKKGQPVLLSNERIKTPRLVKIAGD